MKIIFFGGTRVTSLMFVKKWFLRHRTGKKNEISGVVWPLIFDTLTSKSKWVIYTPQGVLVRLNASVLWKSKIPSPSVHSGVSCKQWTTLPTVSGKSYPPTLFLIYAMFINLSNHWVYYFSQTIDMVLDVQCTTY